MPSCWEIQRRKLRKPASSIEKSEEKGLPVVCLTAYMTDINGEDAKGAEQMQMLRDSLVLARDIGAPVVRLYGGRLVPPEQWERSMLIVAERLRSLVGLCQELKVSIAVENHFGTLTTTAAETMAVVRAVGASEIGVMYDQANISYERGEQYQEAIALQSGHILHVHAKDLVFLEGATESDVSLVTHLSAEKRVARWVLLGHGVLPWKEILQALKNTGYDGYISVEYTYKKAYEGELPVPEIGMKHSLDYLRGLLKAI